MIRSVGPGPIASRNGHFTRYEPWLQRTFLEIPNMGEITRVQAPISKYKFSRLIYIHFLKKLVKRRRPQAVVVCCYILKAHAPQRSNPPFSFLPEKMFRLHRFVLTLTNVLPQTCRGTPSNTALKVHECKSLNTSTQTLCGSNLFLGLKN